jgi:uncharacterized protein (TIGR03437 family)
MTCGARLSGLRLHAVGSCRTAKLCGYFLLHGDPMELIGKLLMGVLPDLIRCGSKVLQPRYQFPIQEPPAVRGYDKDFSGSKHTDNIESHEFRGASLVMLWRPHVVPTVARQLLAMLLVLPCASLAQSTLHTGDTLQVTFSVPSGLSFTPDVIDLAIGSLTQTCTVVNETLGTQTQTSKFFNGTALLGTYTATADCAQPNLSYPIDPLAYFSHSTLCDPGALACGTVVDFTAVLNGTLSGVITTTIDNGTLTFDLSNENVVVRFCNWDAGGNGPCHTILTPTSVQIIPAGGSLGPSLSSLSPNSAAAGASAFTLTVNGSGFVSGSTVQWNGSALPTTYVSASQLTASVSAGLIASQGTANVTVQNSGGVTSNALTFTINPSGTLSLSSLSPNSAIAGGAAFALTVNGSNFVSGATVMWNGSALSTTFIGGSQLTASVSATLIASQGTPSVTVQNPGGATSNALTFTISGPLSVSSLSPNSATAGGAAFTLTVNGSSFVSGATVMWNGSAVSTTFVGGNQLTASVSAGLIASQGTASVTVQNPGGATSNALTFTINSNQSGAASLSSLSPNSATAGGAAFTLTVNGSGFLSGATVQWNGSALSTSFIGGSQLTASVSAALIASQGTASVTVQNPGGATSNALAFTINSNQSVESSLSSLRPSSVAAGASAFTLTVNGSGFLSGATLLWNGSPLFANFSGNQVTAYVTANLIASQGSVSISVRNPDGTTSNTLSFTIGAPTPSISALTPNSATAGGPGFTLTINGSGFQSGSTVVWNNSSLATSFVNFNQLTASVPTSLIASQGSASVTVTEPGGATSNAVTFPINNFISSLSPASATAGGPAFTLTVNGSGYLVGSSVQWNGSPLSSSYVSGTQLTASVPASLIANVGSASVTAVSPGGTPLGSAIFTINPPPATISSLNPNSAPAGGAAFIVTVSGSGFLNGSTVEWNGSALPTTYVNGNQLTASVSTALIATVGGATVTVASPGGAASNPLLFAISPAGNLFISTTSPLPAGTIGASYSQALAATGGVTPYKGWTVTGGNLPPGISLTMAAGALTGLLSGVPTALGTFVFTVQLTDNTNATATGQFSLTINAVAPSILTAGINAASYAGGSVSPGEIVVIFGSGLGPSTLVGPQLDAGGYVSTSLAGTRVLFDGVAAPIIYTQAAQVSVAVPYEVIGKTQVQVVYQGQGSNLVLIPVAAVMPAIFTAGASGHGQGSILNQDGTVNSASNPAAVGSYVSVYATGEGQTNPAGIDGKPAGSPAPRPVAQPITATVGGLPAQVQYAGGAPGLVAGALQANVQIPAGVTSGSNAPIVINIGGQSTQANVTVAIK